MFSGVLIHMLIFRLLALRSIFLILFLKRGEGPPAAESTWDLHTTLIQWLWWAQNKLMACSLVSVTFPQGWRWWWSHCPAQSPPCCLWSWAVCSSETWPPRAPSFLSWCPPKRWVATAEQGEGHLHFLRHLWFYCMLHFSNSCFML